MIERAIDIVITIVIFMAIAYIFINFFGYPTCQYEANQTASHLRQAINEVADDSFPTFKPEDPHLNEPTYSYYYTTVPIKLCQEHGTYSYLLSFVGGMPEYQIYYEHFPERGFMWNEAYPWSGGAASSFVFWAGLRGVTLVGKVGLWKMTKLRAAMDTVTITSKGIEITMKRVDFMKNLKKAGGLENFLQDVLGEFADNNREFSIVLEELAKKDSIEILESLGEAGLIRRRPGVGEWLYDVVDDAGNYKLVIPEEKIPATIIKKVPDPSSPGSYIKQVKEVTVFQDGGGPFDPTKASWNDIDIIDRGATPRPNYVKVTVNPREQMEVMFNSLKETRPRKAEMIADMFVFEDEDNFKPLKDEIMKVNFFRRIYEGVEGVVKGMKDRWQGIKTFLKRHGYFADTTSMPGNEVLYRTRAMEDLAGESSATAQKFRDEILKPMMESKDLGVWDKMKYYASKLPGIDVGPEVDIDKGLSIVKREWEEFGGGFAFLHKSDPTNVGIKMRDLIETEFFNKGNPVPTPTQMVNHIKSLSELEYDKYFKDYGDAGWKDLASKILNNWDHVTLSDLKVASEKAMLETLVEEVDNYEMFQRQLGMLIGMIKKDDSAYPVPLWKKYAGKQVRKMLFIDGTALIAPNSWIGKGLILTQMTEKCEGNSICLYVQAHEYEDPYYLSENATDYSVRVWRPVEWWKRFLGWQAALQQVPSHPRFYVVSPCFAVAKVWKTELDGEPTIFVHPIKVPMEGKSNYCYADTALINAYTTIWAAEDAATIIEAVISWGGSAGKTGIKAVADSTLFKWWDAGDPVSFISAAAEAAINWPGYPYTSLTRTDMLENKENALALQELEETLKSAYE